MALRDLRRALTSHSAGTRQAATEFDCRRRQITPAPSPPSGSARGGEPFEDRRFAYGEERFVTLGPLGDVLVMIVTAETEDHIRIISMRKADRHEQSIYRENLT